MSVLKPTNQDGNEGRKSWILPAATIAAGLAVAFYTSSIGSRIKTVLFGKEDTSGHVEPDATGRNARKNATARAQRHNRTVLHPAASSDGEPKDGELKFKDVDESTREEILSGVMDSLQAEFTEQELREFSITRVDQNLLKGLMIKKPGIDQGIYVFVVASPQQHGLCNVNIKIGMAVDDYITGVPPAGVGSLIRARIAEYDALYPQEE